jgi:hypothetical protein
MRHFFAAALLLLTLAATGCAERAGGRSGAYVGGSVGGNIARDR